MTLLPGSTFAGYHVDEETGRGGMSIVYRATDAQLSRTVALKILSPDLSGDDSFRTRFLEEARAASSIEHPNILPIYGFGEEGGHLYIAMRFVLGAGDLRKVMRQHGALPVHLTLRLLTQAALALDALHDAGIVHRDVKPENLLVASTDQVSTAEDAVLPEAVHLYLADFGLTYSDARPALTSPGQLMATVAYAAPEQVAGRPVQPGTDQYSLACVLFECLTGTRPFVGEHDAAVLQSHLADAPPKISTALPGLPQALDTVIQRGLAKNPTERYPRCIDLLLDASRAVNNAPPATSSDSDDTPTRVKERATIPTAHVTDESRHDARGRTRVVVVATACTLIAVAALTTLFVARSGPTPAASPPSSPPDRSAVTTNQTPASADVAAERLTAAPNLVVPERINSDELDSIDIALHDGEPSAGVTYSVDGAPAGIRVDKDRLVGNVSADAVDGTTSKDALATKEFLVTLTATDATGTETVTVPWRVVDSHLTMPDYVGTYGNGDAGLPNIGTIFRARNQPAFVPGESAEPSTIWHQSAAIGSSVRYGSPVSFYFWEPEACTASTTPACTGKVPKGAG